MCSNLTYLSKNSSNASKPFTVRTKKCHIFGFYIVIKTFEILHTF